METVSDLHAIDEPVQNVLLPTSIPGQYRHGHSRSPTYGAWNRMVPKCTNRKDRDWPRFGAKGVAVCFKWLKFVGFLADMGMKPVEAKALVRIDQTKGYEPGNCVWR